MSQRLRGTRVLVAGAGFAGLAAACALEQDGATTAIVEARDRVGGRVWTIRDGLSGQHAEAGADLIESTQHALLRLIRECRLPVVRILRRGFGYYSATPSGRLVLRRRLPPFFGRRSPLTREVRDFKVGERRWDGAIAARLGRQSAADWLKSVRAPAALLPRLRALRGLFLADPEALSILALVDFLAEDPWAGDSHTLRLTGGNDRLATELARRLRTPPRLHTILRAVRQTRRGVVATVEHQGRLAEMEADYLVSTLPASTLKDVRFEPACPPVQQSAIAALKYGAATRVLLQFAKPFWRVRGRPNAFGSDQPTGAIWDGNEQQPGPRAILSLVAGGGASEGLQQIWSAEGADGVVARLRWLGKPAAVTGTFIQTWEHDPWARGGYAYFDPAFDPRWRDVLAHPHGRVVFAGEHTSIRWQGYMNGAIETGWRAAAEVAALSANPAATMPVMPS